MAIEKEQNTAMKEDYLKYMKNQRIKGNKKYMSYAEYKNFLKERDAAATPKTKAGPKTNWAQNLKKKVKKVLKGGKETTRTKTIEKASGLSEEELKRFKGKK